MKRLNEIENKLKWAIYEETRCAMNEDNEPYCTGEIEIGDLLVTVRGHYWADGYCENDYYNGTGAWIITGATVTIDEIEAYNENGDEVMLDIDENRVCEEVEEEMYY